jgi:hypothetical protein
MGGISSSEGRSIEQLADWGVGDQESIGFQELWHPAVKEPEHQRASMDTVGIGIKKQDDSCKAAFFDIEIVCESGSKCFDQLFEQRVRLDLCTRRFPCIHRLALHR